MLSRIAQGMYRIGQSVERAENVARILEVNHMMHLHARAAAGADMWSPIFESFGVDVDEPSEENLYASLVLSQTDCYSVSHCIASAREEARTLRECISEEMWAHLNRHFLGLGEVSFAGILEQGRSEFNREIETFCDAFHGLADNTMIHGPEYHFLRTGKFLERAAMTCRAMEIKYKALLRNPQEEGRPLDYHQWQALLRSVSGYGPYRRAYNARIVPAQVLELLIGSPLFPRSIRYCMRQVADSLRSVDCGNPAQARVRMDVAEFIEDVAGFDGREFVMLGGIPGAIHALRVRCGTVADGIRQAYFELTAPAPAAPPRQQVDTQ
jgi:uncharacterized alpha-E superfamily protein